MNPSDVSEPEGYGVLDWSLWAENKGVEGAGAVTDYLLDKWPETPCQNMEAAARRRGLAQEINDGAGRQMLLNWGWVPGQALGAGSNDPPLRNDLRLCVPLPLPAMRPQGDKRGLQYPGEGGTPKQRSKRSGH